MAFILDHLSPSAMSMFLRCEVQYAFRYLEGIIAPPSGALVVGSSVHAAQAVRLTARLDDAPEISDDETVDVAVDTLKAKLDSEDVVLDEGETTATLTDTTADATRCLTREVLPTVDGANLVAVERRLDLAVEGRDVGLTVIPDVVEVGAVRDLKIAKVAPKPAEQLQPAAYAYAYREVYGDSVGYPTFRYDVVKKLKTGAKSDMSVKYQATDADISFFFTVFDRLVARIQDAASTGNFVPNPTGWTCSEKFCGYWSRCRGGVKV